jgi:hypothetical protein
MPSFYCERPQRREILTDEGELMVGEMSAESSMAGATPEFWSCFVERKGAHAGAYLPNALDALRQAFKNYKERRP